MSLNQHDLERLGQLSRIDIAAGQEAEYAAALSRIIDLVTALQSASVDDVEPMSNPHDQTATLRPDQITESDESTLFLGLAPEAESGLYLVPQVIG